MGIYKALRKQQSLGAAVFSEIGASSVTGETPEENVQSHIDGEVVPSTRFSNSE